jgi:ribosomal protein S18 acetylase RimI-like enzyme
MERGLDLPEPDPVPGIDLQRYDPGRDHAAIPRLFSVAFDRPQWPDDWDRFDEFDPAGVFLATGAEGSVGFAICFRRGDAGYISVVAVDPAWRRRGIASALVRRAARYLRDLGLDTVRIDAWGDSPDAVATYLSLGFTVYATRIEADAADSSE